MFKRTQKNDDGGWLSLSDMMTVLMVLFLIISVTIAVTSTTRLVKMRGVLSYVSDQEDLLCQELSENLYSKFSTNDIQIECNPIRIIFTNPDYEFAKNSSELTKDFERALSIFFPVYLETVERWELKDLVDEIRIEGHTDSDGGYIYNMKLSQNRARTVLSFAIGLPELNINRNYFEWSRSLLTANGLSFSRRLSKDGSVMRYPFNAQEDKDRSRRVEVKLRTNTKEIIMAMERQY